VKLEVARTILAQEPPEAFHKPYTGSAWGGVLLNWGANQDNGLARKGKLAGPSGRRGIKRTGSQSAETFQKKKKNEATALRGTNFGTACTLMAPKKSGAMVQGAPSLVNGI